MERIVTTPRDGWQRKVQELGLAWHSVGGKPYWNEAAYYSFSADEVDTLDAATAELYRLFVAAGDHIVEHNLFERFGIPERVIPLIKRSWKEEPPCLNHGRFDLGFDGKGPPKLFEFNCDTPTSLFEAAIAQWHWKEAVFPQLDQFNSLHEKLVAKWKDLKPFLRGSIHFASWNDGAGEDTLTITYLRDTALEAGIESTPMFIPDIGWSGRLNRFVDLEGQRIETLWKLYPWEWLVNEKFGEYILESYDTMQWMEPIWKMIWSNKAILPILWELFPSHPNLLPAYFEPRSENYVKKPILAREGANITIVKNGVEVASTDGDYGEAEYVYQDLYQLPEFGDGNFPIIGSWIVDEWPAGMGIREDGLVTKNTSRFVPHVFQPRQ